MAARMPGGVRGGGGGRRRRRGREVVVREDFAADKGLEWEGGEHVEAEAARWEGGKKGGERELGE